MIPLSSEAVLTFILFQDLMRPHLQAQITDFDETRKKAIKDCRISTDECKAESNDSHHKAMRIYNGIINSGSYMSVVAMSFWIQEFNNDDNKAIVQSILSIAHNKAISRELMKSPKAKKVKPKWNPEFIVDTYLNGKKDIRIPKNIFIDLCEAVEVFPRSSSIESIISMFSSLQYFIVSNTNINTVHDVYFTRVYLSTINRMLSEAKLGLPSGEVT